MKRIEMIEMLMNKANIGSEEAEEVLKKFDWDLLDSIVYLERQGKIENKDDKRVVNVEQEGHSENHNKDSKYNNEKSNGVGALMGRIFRGIGNVIRKGNENYVDISKDGEKPIRISLTVSAILTIIASVPVVVLAVIGLFLGYKYSIVGPNINAHKVNDVLKDISKEAQNIKNDFNQGYRNC